MEILDDLDIEKPSTIGVQDYSLLAVALMVMFSLAFLLNDTGYIRLTPLMATIPGWILLAVVGLLEGRLVSRLVSSKIGLILNTIVIFVAGFFLAAISVDDWFRPIKNYEYGTILTGILCGLSFVVITLVWHLIYRIWERILTNIKQERL